MWLISRGHTEASLRAITIEQRAALLDLASRGLIGFTAESIRAYRELSWLEEIRATIVSIVGGKRQRRSTIHSAMPEVEAVLPKPTWREAMRLD